MSEYPWEDPACRTSYWLARQSRSVDFDYVLLQTSLDTATKRAEEAEAIIQRVRDLCNERTEWLSEPDSSPLHSMVAGEVWVALVTVPEILAALDGETDD
jgi:hypothetical protein